jgi:hypothetical protein
MRTLNAPMFLSVAMLWVGAGGFAQPNDAVPEQPFPAQPDAIPKVRAWNEQYATLEDYTRAATNGESEAQYHLGYIYLRGDGVRQDIPRAVGWLKKAAGAGEPRAEYTLGLLHMNGTGVPKDLDEARKWLSLAATWNLSEARAALAELDKLQQKDATHDLLAQAQRGAPAAQYQLAKQLLGAASSVQADLAQARAWLERAAASNHPESAFELGIAYRDGVGGERDAGKARKWLERAAEVGVLRARIALAELDRADTPLAPANLDTAAATPLAAARRGDAQAQFELAMMYLNGERVTRDASAAHDWLIKAASQNHRLAQRTLADALARGVDFEQDYDEAAKWYLRAAQAGDADAQYAIGNLYSVGLGVKASSAESQRWYTAAAKQGNRKAKERLGDVPY